MQEHTMKRAPTAVMLALAIGSLGACDAGDMVEITTGFDLLALARPALAEDGTVVAARPAELVVGDGTTTSSIDLSLSDLTMTQVSGRKPMQVLATGELVFAANRTGTPMGCPLFRGVYETSSSGGPITTAHETCPSDSPGPAVGSSVAMSANGTVAFADIRNGAGAIYRYDFGTAPSVLIPGTGEFFNWGGLDVNDAGQVPIQMEYFDGFAGGLMRAVLVFDTVDQDKEDTDTAVEKLGIGQQPQIAINDAGTVAFSLNSNMSFPIDGTVYMFDAGVYTATPTLFNTPKMLTQVANLSGDYCAFGAVDINDAGQVVFEAQVAGGLNCGGAGYDGIYDGSDPSTDGIVEFGDDRLGNHQFYDAVRLGELNDSGQISFITTYSEPLVAPVYVWRYDP